MVGKTILILENLITLLTGVRHIVLMDVSDMYPQIVGALKSLSTIMTLKIWKERKKSQERIYLV